MTADRILVRPSDEIGERKSPAGILIPATANVNRRLVWAEVVSVGPTVRNVEERDRGPVRARRGLRGRDPGRRVPHPPRARRPRGGVRPRRGPDRPLPLRAGDRDRPRHRAAPRRPGRPRHRGHPGHRPGHRRGLRAGRRRASWCSPASPTSWPRPRPRSAARRAPVLTGGGIGRRPRRARRRGRPHGRRARSPRHRRQQRGDQPGVRPHHRGRVPRGAQDPRGQPRGPAAPRAGGLAGLDARPRRGDPQRRVDRRPPREPVHRHVQRVEGRADPPHPPARARARARGARQRDRARAWSRPTSLVRCGSPTRPGSGRRHPLGPHRRPRRHRRARAVPRLRRRGLDHRRGVRPRRRAVARLSRRTPACCFSRRASRSPVPRHEVPGAREELDLGGCTTGAGAGRRPLVQVGRPTPGVEPLAEHDPQLGLERAVHRLRAHEGLRRFGAPPRELVATLAPAVAAELR